MESLERFDLINKAKEANGTYCPFCNSKHILITEDNKDRICYRCMGCNKKYRVDFGIIDVYETDIYGEKIKY